MMPYNVYLVLFTDSHAIFVETNPADQSGEIYHVTGNLQLAFTFEAKAGQKPEESFLFNEKNPLGTVTVENFPRIWGICSNIPPPIRQYQGSQRLYRDEPIRGSDEWAAEAIEDLFNSRVVIRG